nr:ABC transporter substrate-binding protein [Dietzia maris]
MTVAVPSEKIGTVLPLIAGQAMGEFQKENLAVEVTVMPSADAVQLVASGQIDAMEGSTSVGLLNAVQQGFPVKQIIGDGWLPPESKMGVWRRADVPTAQLKDKAIGSAIGIGSSVNAPLAAVLAKDGLKLTDLKWEVVGAADAATALKNGAVDAAVVLDPFWLQLKDDARFQFVSPAIEPGGNVGGLHAGPRLLDRRDVALALTRAYVRTTNTYLRDEKWQKDTGFMNKLSERLKTPVDVLRAVPGQVYNWDIPVGAATRLQELYIETKTLKAKRPMPESTFVDRSFVATVVGQPRP